MARMKRFSELINTCLVTGGAGFVGRSLVKRLLDEGCRVRALDLSGHPKLDPRAELIVGDICDPATVASAVAGCDAVFHTASMMFFCGVVSPKIHKRMHDVNVGGVKNIIAACRKHQVPYLIYTSSNNVVFDRVIHNGDEEEPYATQHVDIYTDTKIIAERLILAAGRGGGALRTCALRPGGIWGPDEGCLMLRNVLDVLNKGTFVVRIGEEAAADNTHVENLVSAQLLAARGLATQPEKVSGQAYFITDEEPMDPVEWFRPLVEALGHRMPKRRIPVWPMYGLSYLREWVTRFGGPMPELTRTTLLKTTRTHTFRIDKARSHLGYEPTYKSRPGLLECVPFARAYLAQPSR